MDFLLPELRGDCFSQQSNESYGSVGNLAPVKSFFHKPSWVSQNNAHSSAEWLSPSSGYLFTLQTLFCADTLPARRRVQSVSVKKKENKENLHILYIDYMVSPLETGHRTAITAIGSLAGWGAYQGSRRGNTKSDKCPRMPSAALYLPRWWALAGLFSPSFSTNNPMGRPDKILLSHPLTPVFLVLSARYLDWQEYRVTPFNSISLSQEVASITGSWNPDFGSSCVPWSWTPNCFSQRNVSNRVTFQEFGSILSDV